MYHVQCDCLSVTSSAGSCREAGAGWEPVAGESDSSHVQDGMTARPATSIHNVPMLRRFLVPAFFNLSHKMCGPKRKVQSGKRWGWARRRTRMADLIEEDEAGSADRLSTVPRNRVRNSIPIRGTYSHWFSVQTKYTQQTSSMWLRKRSLPLPKGDERTAICTTSCRYMATRSEGLATRKARPCCLDAYFVGRARSVREGDASHPMPQPHRFESPCAWGGHPSSAGGVCGAK